MTNCKKDFTDEILNSIAEGLFTVDKEFRITYINKAGQTIVGRNFDEIIGKTCKEVCNSHLCELECVILKAIETKENIYGFNSVVKNSENKSVPVKLNAAVLTDTSGEPTGAVVSFCKIEVPDKLKEYFNDSTDFYGIVGKSKKMQDIYRLTLEVANSDASIIVYGETGVGKELVADAIMKSSKRKDKPYIKVNCASLPETLLASELFGHVRGAFTDALNDRIGRFEAADGGTIFLDEITEIPKDIQVKLLRILQDGTFERVGESKTRKVDARVIAATNKNIYDEVSNKKFREDLFYRLNVLSIFIPPLRERREDIPLLVDFFMRKFSITYNRSIYKIDGGALKVLLNYNWPGNIRELENAIEYAFIRSKRNMSICINCLPPHIIKPNKNIFNSSINSDAVQFDKEQLLNLLEQNEWNQSKVAKILGVNRTTIWRQLKSLGIKK